MKKFYLMDNQGFIRGEVQASKHSEARYKIMNSNLLPIIDKIKEINRSQVKIYGISEVYRSW